MRKKLDTTLVRRNTAAPSETLASYGQTLKMNQFTIKVSEIRVHAQIGARPEERLLGQSLVVALMMTVRGRPENDDVSSTLDYGQAIACVKHHAETCGQVKLLETFAQNLASALLKDFTNLVHVRVTVQKNYVPVPDFTGHVCVTVEDGAGAL